MGYEILSDELFQEDDGGRKKRPRPVLDDGPVNRRSNKKFQESTQSNIPFAIHIILVIVFLVIVGYLLLTFFDSDKKEDRNELNILGGLSSFEYNYQGDLKIKANKFEIESSTGKFNDVNKDIDISNFNKHLIKLF